MVLETGEWSTWSYCGYGGWLCYHPLFL